jgi:hypothetical protein
VPSSLQAKTILFEHIQVLWKKSKSYKSLQAPDFFGIQQSHQTIVYTIQSKMGLTDDFDEEDRP